MKLKERFLMLILGFLVGLIFLITLLSNEAAVNYIATASATKAILHHKNTASLSIHGQIVPPPDNWNFKQRSLQRTPGSNPSEEKETREPSKESIGNLEKQEGKILEKMSDQFNDVAEILEKEIRRQGRWKYSADIFDIEKIKSGVAKDGYDEADLVNEGTVTIGKLINQELSEGASAWERFQMSINDKAVYEDGSKDVERLLKLMTTLPFGSIEQKDGGTQFKLTVEFGNNEKALLKPMRYSRMQETLPNHFYFTDFERHHAEIAAFHLDRLLGFHRTVPVAGRIVNITSDIYELAGPDLLKTFFVSPAGNLCFHGKCSYYCDTSHAICGQPDMLEVSLAAYLPDSDYAPRKTWRHPWRRSYHKRRKANWESDPNYCEVVKEAKPYEKGRRLLDIMDMAVFDFIMGNLDRHHYETIRLFGGRTYPIHLDHGRAFGQSKHDELTILAPIYQCCMMRSSTLNMLLKYHRSPLSLGQALKNSLKEDAVNPVLLDPHFLAVDRRVGIILQVIRECLNTSASHGDVIFKHDDLYDSGAEAVIDKQWS